DDVVLAPEADVTTTEPPTPKPRRLSELSCLELVETGLLPYLWYGPSGRPAWLNYNTPTTNASTTTENPIEAATVAFEPPTTTPWTVLPNVRYCMTNCRVCKQPRVISEFDPNWPP